MHSATSLADNTIEEFAPLWSLIFSTPKLKKFWPQGKEIIVFLEGGRVKHFPVRGKISLVDSGLKRQDIIFFDLFVYEFSFK